MKTIQYKFVEFIPDVIEEEILYISIDYCTAVHKCVCGCGNEVVTPFSPTDWERHFNGKTVSLFPSIGNWSFECRSHYWIKKSNIEFAESWNEKEIYSGRNNDLKRKKEFYNEFDSAQEKQLTLEELKCTFWEKLYKFLRLGRPTKTF